MEASRNSRRTTQTQHQTQTNVTSVSRSFGNQSHHPKAVSVRPQPQRRSVRSTTTTLSDVAQPRARLQPLRPMDGVTLQPVSAKPVIAEAKAAPKPAAKPVVSKPAIVLPAIDMELPGEASPERSRARIFNPRWRKARVWTSRAAALGLVLVITLGGLLFSQSYLKAHKAFQGTAGTAAALKADVQPELLKGEGAGRINVLLMGRGGGNHDAPDLTDTLIVASIDPVNHTSTLVSVPRDLWVNVAGGGAMKLNAAWQTGEFKYLGKIRPGSTDKKAIQAGFDSVDATLKDVLGIDINYNMILDFQAFQQAVDTVGGVSINVPTDLVDPTMAWENANNPVLAKAGPQTFDGKHALIYARSRETSSDFARSQRQRALMLALKQKVETAGTISNPVKLSKLVSAFGDNVATDLSMSNASRLYSIMKQIPESSTVSAGLGDQDVQLITTGNLNGQSVVLPKAGIFNFKDINAYMRTKLQDPYLKKEHAKVIILNGTTLPGLATAKADELKSYGYNVVSTGNTPGNNWTQTTLVDLTHKNKYTKNYLEKRLNVTAANSLSDTSIQTNGADFAIILGSDESTNTQP